LKDIPVERTKRSATVTEFGTIVHFHDAPPFLLSRMRALSLLF
jgi:hypothetical protein